MTLKMALEIASPTLATVEPEPCGVRGPETHAESPTCELYGSQKHLLGGEVGPAVSQILGNPLDHSSFAVLSWLVVRIHCGGVRVRWPVTCWKSVCWTEPQMDALQRELRPVA